MRRIVPAVAWCAASPPRGAARPLDARLLPLLRAIAERRTLTAAAGELAMPYRSAWAMLEEAEAALGGPLVVSTRGRGGELTALARRLVAADERARTLLQARSLAVEIEPADLRGAHVARPVVTVAASHDLALAQLRDAWRVRHQVALDFRGSEDSLASFLAGRAELAGFHVPADAGADDPLLARLDPARHARLRFLRREQGLILPAGNPAHVRGLADLARKRLRIVNRQPGSGTRLLFDRMLAEQGIPATALPGYTDEEFTHAAVAATVAAGRAQAAFGVRAAAAQFKLAFVPLAQERYQFACHRSALASEPIGRFRALLASAATRKVVKPLPGYALDAPGEPEAAGSRAKRAAR